jgi:hypothetical protein
MEDEKLATFFKWKDSTAEVQRLLIKAHRSTGQLNYLT